MTRRELELALTSYQNTVERQTETAREVGARLVEMRNTLRALHQEIENHKAALQALKEAPVLLLSEYQYGLRRLKRAEESLGVLEADIEDKAGHLAACHQNVESIKPFIESFAKQLSEFGQVIEFPTK